MNAEEAGEKRCFCRSFLLFLFHSVDGFCTEPVGIKVGIAKGTVQADGSFVPVHNLKIRLCGAEAPSFFRMVWQMERA